MQGGVGEESLLFHETHSNLWDRCWYETSQLRKNSIIFVGNIFLKKKKPPFFPNWLFFGHISLQTYFDLILTLYFRWFFSLFVFVFFFLFSASPISHSLIILIPIFLFISIRNFRSFLLFALLILLFLLVVTFHHFLSLPSLNSNDSSPFITLCPSLATPPMPPMPPLPPLHSHVLCVSTQFSNDCPP